MKKNRKTTNKNLNRLQKQIRTTDKNKSSSGKKNRIDYLKTICWIIVPIIVTVLLVLDALSVYTFTKERLLVLGVGLIIILVPFFSEITVKDFSFKRNKTKNHT